MCLYIGEQDDENITKIKSQNANFLENDFPKRGEIKGSETLFELPNSNDGFVLDE